jgi:hypothetical protein
VASSSEYHHKQAETLIRLAQSTRDPDTASALMRLAAEHRALTEQVAPDRREDSDQNAQDRRRPN